MSKGLQAKMLFEFLVLVALVTAASLPAQGSTLQDIMASATPSVDGEIRLLVRNMVPQQRPALLNDEAKVKEIIDQEARRQSLLKAVESSGVFKDSDQAFLLRRQIEQLLINNYIQFQQNTNVDADYPGDEQLRQYYDANQASFVLEERRHVFQIFMPITAGMTDKEIAGLRKEAKGIVKQLKRGKVTFADAALQHSRHEGSRLNGGYMGLLKLSSLVPEIRDEVRQLSAGQISSPIRAEDGFHIIQVGDAVGTQTVAFADAKSGIRQMLLKQYVNEIRRNIVNQTLSAYPPKPLSEADKDKLVAEMKKIYQ